MQQSTYTCPKEKAHSQDSRFLVQMLEIQGQSIWIAFIHNVGSVSDQIFKKYKRFMILVLKFPAIAYLHTVFHTNLYNYDSYNSAG